MAYVVYHVQSTMREKTIASESGAKRSVTCMNRKAVQRSIRQQSAHIDVYAYASEEDYNTKVVKMKTVKNLMTGKEIQIPSNTPIACDPSSETYWSA